MRRFAVRHLLGDAAAQADHLDRLDLGSGHAASPPDGPACGAARRKASRSSWVMRPAGPVPRTWRRSMPARARAGAPPARPAASRRPAAAAPAIAARGRRDGLGRRRTAPPPLLRAPASACARTARRRWRRWPHAVLRSPPRCLRPPPPGAPARRRPRARSPTSPPSATTVPATGDGISTVALSVITSASGWSSRTDSPTLTCHSTISASATPSPTSGSLMMRVAHAQASITALQRAADAGRARGSSPIPGRADRACPSR